MARLPDATQLARRQYQPSSGNINVKTPDVNNIARAGDAVAGGLTAIGRGIEANVQAQDEIDDFDTKLKMIDFRLQTEMELEDQKRQMQPGGAGWSQSWEQTFRKRAREFVGKEGKNFNPAMLPKVELALAQQEAALSERAQRYEIDERDRHHIDSLETTLGKTRDMVAANPTERERWLKEGESLIETSKIAPASKYRLRGKYAKEVDKAYGDALVNGIQSADDLATLKGLAAPTAPDRRNEKLELKGGKISRPQGWAATNPDWQALDGFQRAAAMALLEADGRDPEAARNALGAMLNRASKEKEDLGSHVSRSIYQPVIEPAQEARLRSVLSSPAHKELVQWAQRRANGEEADPVGGATHFLAHEKTMLDLEAREPNKYKSWRSWTGFDGKEYRGVRIRDKSHAFLTPGEEASLEQRGPMQSLSIDERRAIYSRGEQRYRQLVGDTEKIIKEQMSVASDGILPPENVITAVRDRVVKLKDPLLSAQFDTMVRRADITSRLQQVPPAVQEEMLRRDRDYLTQNGATKEQKEDLDHREKVAAATRKQVNEDPMTHAHRTGINVPLSDGPPDNLDPAQRAQYKIPVASVQLEPLDFYKDDIDLKLARRFEQAVGVARYQGQPPQAFTKVERDFLKDRLRDGGPVMLHVLGKIVKASKDNGISPIMVMKEFGGAPEVAMMGNMVAEGVHEDLLRDAAASFNLRKTEGDKFISKIDRPQVKTAMATVAPAVRGTPGYDDDISRMADAVYEYRHRRMGKASFDLSLYQDGIREILGERKVGDVVYGGPGNQGAGGFKDWHGWGDGKSTSTVIVPPNVRQDAFDDLIGALKPEDLQLTGQPMSRSNTPLSIAKIKQAEWVSVGGGRYGLQFDTDPDGTAVMALDSNGKRFVFDLNPVMDRLQKRKPEIFLGYKP